MMDLKKSYEVYSLLKNIEQKFGASEFGRICQALLALSFKESGYDIPIVQFTARPDIQAKKNSNIYVIEAKAPLGNSVIIKKEDLIGIEYGNEQPIIAILLYEIEPRWMLLDARLLHPGQFRKISLETFSIDVFEKEINPIFLDVVKEYYDVTIKGGVTSLINTLK